jgi:hypothetical protein
MPRKQKNAGEFRFTIDAFTPSTIPLLRLADYMRDFAIMLGNEGSVHPGERLEPGSTVLVAKVEREAEPKVRERLRAIRNRDGNDRAMEAAARLDVAKPLQWVCCHRICPTGYAPSPDMPPAGYVCPGFPRMHRVN